MKILINSINYAPELVGIGKYTAEMAEWLAEAGHDVKVVTAAPYYPDWKVFEGYSAYKYMTETKDGAKVIRCPLWVPARPSGAKRVLHLVSFALTAFPVMIWQGIFWRPDILFVVEPPFFCTPGALLSTVLGRGQSWLHIQDFEIDAAFDLGMLKSKKLRLWVSSVESWLMRKFDRVSTISDRMMDRVINKGVAAEKTVLFENWVDTELIFPLLDRPALYRELGLPENRTIVLYSGNMGEKQGLEIIIEVARLFRERQDILFILCGTGSANQRLKHFAKDLDNVVFFPLQPVEKLNELLNLANIHLLPQKSGAEDLVMPSKLTNMMASGKPVVATAAEGSQISRVLTDCGMVVEPGDVKAFYSAVEYLADNPDSANRLGINGRAYVEAHWNMNDVLSKIFVN